MLRRAEGSGRVAFREADHRAGLCISPELARSSSRGAGMAGHPGAGVGGQHPAGHLARHRPRGARQSGPHRGRGPPGPVRCGQGWTGPLGPRSRRNDYMIANVAVAGKISMSAAASTAVSRWALPGSSGPGRELTGDRRELGADLGQADSAPGQRVNRPVVALCRNADHGNQVTTAHRDGGYRRRGRFVLQWRTAVISPILPDYVPVPRASLGPAVSGRGYYVGGWSGTCTGSPTEITTRYS
jgi:hypothetical protein